MASGGMSAGPHRAALAQEGHAVDPLDEAADFARQCTLRRLCQEYLHLVAVDARRLAQQAGRQLFHAQLEHRAPLLAGHLVQDDQHRLARECAADRYLEADDVDEMAKGHGAMIAMPRHAS
ncbi:hypothetical protein BV378_14410 [Nostoc sp. RF31YmG]|nr:hypothetical protein BV378_14410 [Nostoc sp. RF31YmG]